MKLKRNGFFSRYLDSPVAVLFSVTALLLLGCDQGGIQAGTRSTSSSANQSVGQASSPSSSPSVSPTDVAYVFSNLAEKVIPSVVNISTLTTQNTAEQLNSELFEQFFGDLFGGQGR